MALLTKQNLTFGLLGLVSLLGLPFTLNYYNVSYSPVITLLHIIMMLLCAYSWHLYRESKKTKDSNQELNDNRKQILLRENVLKSLFDNNNSYLWTIDFAEKTFLPSIGFEQVYGFSRDEFMNNYELWKDRVIPEDMDIAEEHYARLKSGLPSNRMFRFRNSNEEIRWLDAWGTPIFNDKKEVTHLTGVAYDITDRKELEEKLYHSATHDDLTGLPNRKKLMSHMKSEIEKCQEKNQSFAVLFLDLDRFKFINDNYGHNTGDKLLIQIGNRLQTFIDGKGIVSRHGGDEFIIIIRYNKYKQFKELVNGILDTFKTAYDLNIENSTISASIGISMYPKDATTIEGLIGQADRAMYRAKAQGKNTYRFANPVLEQAEIRKNSIEKQLKKALEQDEFELYYQPKVVLKTGDIFEAETVIDWHNSHLGRVSATEFIPLAESHGLMDEIGLWVLDEAMKQGNRWKEMGIDIRLSVNVSIIQFENPLFLRNISNLLSKNHYNAENLTLEITENILQNTQHASNVIHQLQNMGFEIAIDDFGTGYSSLSVINALPIDTIKIDKSFVLNILENEHNAKLVETIISLGDAIDCKVMAEGIETVQQSGFLKQIGCLYGQGSFYSSPKKAEEFQQMYEEQLA